MNNKQLTINNSWLWMKKPVSFIAVCLSSAGQFSMGIQPMKIISLFIVNCLLIIAPLRGQVAIGAERQYKAAVQLVKIGDHERAKTELNPIIQRGGSLAPFAAYYYALAAFRQKNWTQSRLMLKQLMGQYPDWRRRDDGYYLFAAVCFETTLYDEGLQSLAKIGDPDLRGDIDKLERFFMPKITDLAQLKTLSREFPDNRNLGLRLVERIQQTSTDRADLQLSDQLTNRFGLPPIRPASTPVAETTVAGTTAARPPTTTAATRTTRNPNKGYWNVAAVLPFRIDAFGQNQRGQANQFVYDWYAGMRLAKAKLQAEGITVNLFAYDLDNDINKALELINNPAFGQNDLVVGPLYAEPNRIVAAYTGLQNILLVNPMATSADLILNQPTAFLAQPSAIQQARKAVAFARDLNGIKRAAVYFGTARKDSLLALAYQAELKKQGFQVLDFHRATGKGAEMMAMMKISEVNRPGHVFYATSNADDGSRMLDALSRLGVGGPLLVTSGAFDYYQAPLSTFTRRELYLLYPEFMDTERESVTQFRDSFLAKWHIIPSVYAAQGYDTLLFFARQLARSAGAPVHNVRSDTDDYVLAGFDYTQSNDNQAVPIVKFDGGRFVRLNN
jgi:ABC-type branched-subunit amino acid transport system substrate-binding protein